MFSIRYESFALLNQESWNFNFLGKANFKDCITAIYVFITKIYKDDSFLTIFQIFSISDWCIWSQLTNLIEGYQKANNGNNRQGLCTENKYWYFKYNSKNFGDKNRLGCLAKFWVNGPCFIQNLPIFLSFPFLTWLLAHKNTKISAFF